MIATKSRARITATMRACGQPSGCERPAMLMAKVKRRAVRSARLVRLLEPSGRGDKVVFHLGEGAPIHGDASEQAVRRAG